MHSSNANKILLMGIIGFAAGMLFAPDKGSVTREKLKHKADELADEATKKKEEAKSKLRNLRRKKDEVTDEVDDRMASSRTELVP